MQKRGKNLHIKGAAFSEIFILIMATLAFAFVLAESSRVAADKWFLDKGAAVRVTPQTPAPQGAPTFDSMEQALASVQRRGTGGGGDGADGGGQKRDSSPTPTEANRAFQAYATQGTYTVNPGVLSKDLKIGTRTYTAGTEITNFEVYKDGTGTVTYKRPGEGPTTIGMDKADTAAFANKGKEEGLINAPKTSQTDVGAGLTSGITWAVAAFSLGQTIGAAAGWQQKQTLALSTALATAAFIYQFVSTGLGGELYYSLPAAVIGGAVVFALMYKKEKKKTVTFTCLPYEPPLKGAKCEECNKNLMKPCSEYRCKSLGQACELLNKDQPGKEQCAWVNPNDVSSPTITPWVDALSPKGIGLKYISDTSIRPPALGVKIVKDSDKCLPAYTKLEFGITTNEPSRCKIDTNFTKNISDMQFYFGDDNTFKYNHTQIMKLPGPNLTELTGPLMKDGTMSLFVRCEDANGNQNVDEYKITFCVEQGPDTTPPRVEGTSIIERGAVRYNADKVPIDVYINEPAECKWSKDSKAFEDMENTMDCAETADDTNVMLTYTCSGNLTGIKNNQENTFYFKCKDQPTKPDSERNVMVTSYSLTIRGSQPLNILKITPAMNETVRGSTDPLAVELTVITDDGSDEGKAICSFSETGQSDSYTQMFETDSFKHNQSNLMLPSGPTGTKYNYYFRCIDPGGNLAENFTTFTVFADRTAPKVARVYKDEAVGLKVVTDEEAICAYSWTTCNFEIDNGIKMTPSPNIRTVNFAEWKANSLYYIKCQDRYGNPPSDINECSIIVQTV